MRDRHYSKVYELIHGWRAKSLEAPSVTLMSFPVIERKCCGADLLKCVGAYMRVIS
jgi:hypothetical protein